MVPVCLVEVADGAYLGLDLSTTSRAFETNDPVKLEVLAVLGNYTCLSLSFWRSYAFFFSPLAANA